MSEAQIQNKRQNMQKSDYNCPVCHGSNYELFPAAELEQIDEKRYRETIEEHKEVYGSIDFPSQEYAIPCRRCNGGYAFRVESTRQRANIPPSFYDKRLCDFDWSIYKDNSGNTIDITEKKNAVEDFVNEFNEWDKKGMGFYICSGMKGSGKTFLASCIFNSLIDKYQIMSRFVSASQLLNISKNSDGSGNYERDQIALLCNCKLLCIDDIGQKNCGSEWLNDVMFQIVNERYQQKLVTLFTSNLNIQQLSNVVDERVADRINRMTLQMTLPEYSVRSKEANEQKLQFLKERGLVRNN